MSISITYPQLAGQAQVDPWRIRDDFAVGSPAEIEALATAFAKAGKNQHEAAELARHGTTLAGQGYHVDDTTPFDVDAEVARAERDLGDSGTKAIKIATLLDEVAQDLAARTTTAKSDVATLEGNISNRIATYNQWLIDHPRPASMPDADWGDRDKVIDDLVAMVRTTGAPLSKSITEYETNLGRHLKSMSDLGVLPPDALTVDAGDYTVAAGATDGQSLVNAEKSGNTSAALAAAQRVSLLNAKLKAGGKLSAAEQAYLDSFYNTVGADGLAGLSTWAGKDPAHKQVMGSIADGVMNLSNPAKTHDGEADVPKPIVDLTTPSSAGSTTTGSVTRRTTASGITTFRRGSMVLRSGRVSPA